MARGMFPTRVRIAREMTILTTLQLTVVAYIEIVLPGDYSGSVFAPELTQEIDIANHQLSIRKRKRV